VEVFADVFKKQVYEKGPYDPELVQKCVATATSQAVMVSHLWASSVATRACAWAII
jgi:hypothetical protein